MAWEETFPPGNPSRSRSFELEWDARVSYFMMGFSHLVCLDELYRDQHRLRPEEAYTYPDVHRLAIGVREHTLGNTDLLTTGS